MRRPLLPLFLLISCGQTTAMGDRGQTPEQVSAPTVVRPAASVQVAAATDAAAPAPVPPASPLENAGRLGHFFTALAAVDDGTATEDVRVLQFGDSHTAADLETGTVRQELQARFGDGGRGFLELGRPWRTYYQEGIKSPGMTHSWKAEHGKLEHGHLVGDGCYGLAGWCLLTSKRNARAWTEVTAPSSRIELDYFAQPKGGSFELLVDGLPAARVSTRAKTAASAYKEVDVPDGPHRLEVRARGDGEVRFFGVSLDRAKVGVVYDALGINGARAATTLQWNEQHMAEQIRHRSPNLVVLAYGTNESADDQSMDLIERQLVDALGRVARAVPSASCLLLGPPDRAIESDTPAADGGKAWVPSQRVQDIVQVERRVAKAAGCGFYDQLTAMGGPGTMITWADEDPPRAQHDHTHMTRDGYAVLGELFAADLLRAYTDWRAQKNLPPVAAPPPRPTITPSDAPPAGSGEGEQSPFVAIPL